MRRCLLFVFLLPLFVSLAGAQTDVRIGVLGLFHAKELVVQPDGPQAIVIKTEASEILLNGEHDRNRLAISADGEKLVIRGVAGNRCTAEARDGSPVRFRISIPGKISRVYEGKLLVTAHRGVMSTVVSMDREKAVASVVSAEMPTDANPEALKAQAVVTRSFLVAGPRHHDFDFCDTTHCQFLRSPDDASAMVLQAVESTRNFVLSWRDRIIPALYSSRCGGQTRSLADVGMQAGDSYPYYSVQCKWCRQHPAYWERRVNPASLAPKAANESARIAYVRQWGWSALPGSAFRITSGKSGVMIEGRSIGHSLGLCQSGAMGLANAGADFRSILAYYYPGTKLAELPE